MTTTQSARTITAALGCAVLLGLAGCGLKQPFPAKSFYTIDVPPPAGAASSARGDETLRVAEVRVASPFDERAFHYQQAPGRFETDYYVNFITDPASIITGTLIEWLSKEGSFAAVVDRSSPAETRRTLDGRISALYGDYRDQNAPKAVVRAQFFLLDESGAEARVIFNREYAAEQSMSASEPAALIEAWGTALERIYAALARDIGQVDVRVRNE